MGAIAGNQNARKKHWGTAVERAVLDKDPASQRRRLDAIAQRLVSLTESENESVALAAMKELGDRLDGKPAQAITGADGGPLEIVSVPWLKDRDLAGR